MYIRLCKKYNYILYKIYNFIIKYIYIISMYTLYFKIYKMQCIYLYAYINVIYQINIFYIARYAVFDFVVDVDQKRREQSRKDTRSQSGRSTSQRSTRINSRTSCTSKNVRSDPVFIMLDCSAGIVLRAEVHSLFPEQTLCSG